MTASSLFVVEASWSPATDPESGIRDYVFAIGTASTPTQEAAVTGWRCNGPATHVKIYAPLTAGETYVFSVRATNGAGLSGTVVHVSFTATPKKIGESDNRISLLLDPAGIGADGTAAPSWSAERAAALSDFTGRMISVIESLYGPPASSYSVRLVRDLRYSASAVYVPSTDEIHAGDDVSYQLLTHELVHAFRRDQVLTSGSHGQYDPTLSGFEEGFAQAVSYEAMTEFAGRYPGELSQSVYESSHEWDYDFQNVPELATRDFWSDSGGMLLYWTRYEMAAAAIAKIEREHPGFHRAFNAEYYRRLNLDPLLTPSRGLVKDIIQSVVPTIEGRPADRWVDLQHVFDCEDRPGTKIWLSTQHYPAPADYFVFHQTYFYETFANGSDWAHPNGSGGFDYYAKNGSLGSATLQASDGSVVFQTALRIAPTDNPPVFNGFGSDGVTLTTQGSNLPWPGGDPTRFATGLSSLELYRLTVRYSAEKAFEAQAWRVVGAAVRDGSGVFGGVVGASGGTITFAHRGHPPDPPVPVVRGAFFAKPSWASIVHPDSGSVDAEPGLVDVTYVDAAGGIHTDVRTIGFGNVRGGEVFLFDVSQMRESTQEGPAILSSPSDVTVPAGQNAAFTAAASGFPSPAYRWQVSADDGARWTDLSDGAGYAGSGTSRLTVIAPASPLDGRRYRAVASNALGSAASKSAALRVAPASGATGALFHTLVPCRAFDSRSGDGPSAAGPALAAGSSRILVVSGRCGIPPTAVALSANVTVTDAESPGSVVAFPGDQPVPDASTVSFRTRQTRANNSMIKLSSDGSGTIGVANSAAGSVNFLIDVNGYFE